MTQFHFKKAPIQSYAEIGQQSVITFALALRDNEESTEIVEKFYPFKCRDFFNEIVWKQWTGIDYPIYSFQTKNFPVVKDEIIYLTCHNVPDNDFDAYKEALSAFDSNLEVFNIDDVMFVKLPKHYIRYTFLMSYLSFFIRIIERFPNAVFDHTQWNGNEGNYAQRIALMTKKNMAEVYEAFKEFVKDPKHHFEDHCGIKEQVNGVSYNHDCTGIVAVLTNPKNLFRKFCDGFWQQKGV